MATAVVYTAMSAERARGVHPFFARINGDEKHSYDENDVPNSAEQLSGDPPQADLVEGAIEKIVQTTGRKRVNKGEKPSSLPKKQQTLNDVVGSGIKIEQRKTIIDPSASNLGLHEPRYKRQRTDELVENSDNLRHDAIQAKGFENDTANGQPSIVTLSTSDNEEGPFCTATLTTGPNTPPKKMLRLKANGRFSSPVHEVNDHDQSQSGPKRKRGRPRKPSPVLLVKIPYGIDLLRRQVISATITRILNDEQRFTRDEIHPQPEKKTPSKPKETHPFFLGKPKQEPVAQIKTTPRKASAVTPGKLRLHSLPRQQQEQDERANDSFGSGLFKDRLMVRHPGARDPPFPLKGQVHIRGSQETPMRWPTDANEFYAKYGRRKCKEARMPLPERESIILQRTVNGTTEFETRMRPDGFLNPDPSLHVPQRRLLCGDDIAERVSRQLHTMTFPPNRPDVNLSSRTEIGSPVQMLWERIPTAMTAFDRDSGETLGWTQKYAPVTASEVLQPRREMLILRDWLKSLAVRTVSTGIQKEPQKTSTKPRKKRKKKSNDLDDFLVDSDDDVHDMDEILDLENDFSIGFGKPLKSVVQVSHDGSKLSNAVLLSGPAGCGKTAAAYAVAKELGYKIFELNPGERRSGKDIVERVGDMAENHLVKHHGTDSADDKSAEEPSRIDEAFRRDLESGRQGKMDAFFKPPALAKALIEKKTQRPKVMHVVQDAVKKPSKEQQQSLILLEEVDVLFREDKDFWTVVLKMVVDSKRPFIMTCNDEDVVPLQAIKLHAVLRLSQPPEDLATDYMLLVAAAEGHLLDRHAVLSLYRSKAHDLRATLTQLDFWCQMGIGDPRGGLSWIFQRWPPGSDLDEKGRKLRVISDGTYQESIGLVPSTDELETDDRLQFAWSEFGIDPAVALGWGEMHPEMITAADEMSMGLDQQQFTMLKKYTDLADYLSAADICSTSCNLMEPPLDPTAPEMPDKARNQYAEGMKLLQTDETTEHSHLSQELLIAMTRSAFEVTSHSRPPQFLPYITSTKHRNINLPPISRRAFACFDAIATPEDHHHHPISSTSTSTMLQSTFDGPLKPIALDLAPYVRSIVRYDRALEDRRERVDRLLDSDGRRSKKRARTTRAARSALEGGQRATTRRERWFTRDLDYDAVLATGGETWRRGGVLELLEEEDEGGSKDDGTAATDRTGSPDVMDEAMGSSGT